MCWKILSTVPPVDDINLIHCPDNNIPRRQVPMHDGYGKHALPKTRHDAILFILVIDNGGYLFRIRAERKHWIIGSETLPTLIAIVKLSQPLEQDSVYLLYMSPVVKR